MCDISTTQRYDCDHFWRLGRHNRARSGGVVTVLMARPHAGCAAPHKSAAPRHSSEPGRGAAADRAEELFNNEMRRLSSP
jgi:hypothetical protein